MDPAPSRLRGSKSQSRRIFCTHTRHTNDAINANAGASLYSVLKKREPKADQQQHYYNYNANMNDQSETTASPSEPKLCKMGCGFFVSDSRLY